MGNDDWLSHLSDESQPKCKKSQGVVSYNQNLQKHKYLSGISTVLHETFRRGLIFLSQLK